MKPRNKALAPVERRALHHARRAAIECATCRHCSRSIEPSLAERVITQLARLGVSQEALTAHAPICGRCLELVADLAIAIRDKGAA